MAYSIHGSTCLLLFYSSCFDLPICSVGRGVTKTWLCCATAGFSHSHNKERTSMTQSPGDAIGYRCSLNLWVYGFRFKRNKHKFPSLYCILCLSLNMYKTDLYSGIGICSICQCKNKRKETPLSGIAVVGLSREGMQWHAPGFFRNRTEHIEYLLSNESNKRETFMSKRKQRYACIRDGRFQLSISSGTSAALYPN